MPIHQKKRAFEKARQAAMTKLGSKRIHIVRGRGGNLKYRALRLDSGVFSWGSESITKKARILNVVYNATSNELVRTNTVTKNTIVQVDAHPFINWYQTHYGMFIGKQKEGEQPAAVKVSKSVTKKQESRGKDRTLDETLEDQFKSGRLFACISSRPGQSGRADGYIIEGTELDFYKKKMEKKKAK